MRVRLQVARPSGPRWQIGAVLTLLMAMAGALAALGYYGAQAAYRVLWVENPRYELRVIDARSDGRLTPEEILEFGRLTGVRHLFEIDLRRVHETLEQLPLVRTAVVRRRLPDTLEVRITERLPLARAALPRAGYTDAVDREGVLLGPRFASPRLPLLEGAEEPGSRPGQQLTAAATLAALQVLDLCQTQRHLSSLRIRRIDVSPPDYLLVELHNGDRVRVPREHLEPKLRRLVTILRTIADQNLPRGPEPLEIDLTTEEVFPVRGLRMDPTPPARPGR